MKDYNIDTLPIPGDFINHSELGNVKVLKIIDVDIYGGPAEYEIENNNGKIFPITFDELTDMIGYGDISDVTQPLKNSFDFQLVNQEMKLGNVDEASTTEDGAVKSAELVVSSWDDFAKELAENLRMLHEALGRADKNNTVFSEVVFHAGVSCLTVKLCFDTSEKLTFLLGDAKTLEGLLDVIGDFFPGSARLLPFG